MQKDDFPTYPRTYFSFTMLNTTTDEFIMFDKRQIFADAILWMEGDWNYTRIHTVDNVTLLSSYTLKCYQQQLPGFWRIRKDAMVNAAHVFSIKRVANDPKKLQVTLTNGVQIMVARRRQFQLRHHWAQHTGRFRFEREAPVS
nr:LytTR family DNA-binding domain-containing protein [uncultured Arsenicibacter sp.]